MLQKIPNEYQIRHEYKEFIKFRKQIPMTENRTVVTMLQNLSQKQATEQACLMVIYGSHLGRKYYLTDLPLIIGRANNCAVFLEGESI